MAEGESKIVEAVGSAGAGGGSKKGGLGKKIEAAMSEAILECQRRGITEPNKVKAAMMAARTKAKEEYNKQEAEAVNQKA